jgi:hypothetical protein
MADRVIVLPEQAAHTVKSVMPLLRVQLISALLWVVKKLQHLLAVTVVLFTVQAAQAVQFQALVQAVIGTVQAVVQDIPVTTAVVR